MATDDPTDESGPNLTDDWEQSPDEVVWPKITGRRGDVERLTLIIYPAFFPVPTSPIDHEVLYRNHRAYAEQQFFDHYEMWEQCNKRNPTHLVVNGRLTEIRADDYIAADLLTWCRAFICEVLECHADYLLDCGDSGEKALRCFDQFAATLRDETHEYKWMPGIKALNLRAEDYFEAFLRDARETISSVRGRLARIAWIAERQHTDEELYRSPVEQTSQSAGRSDEANSDAHISVLSPVEDLKMVGPTADVLVADEGISSATVSQPTLGGRLDNLAAPCAQSWHSNLRAARAAKKLSRPNAASRLVKQGVRITKHAIKKHEEAKAKPRPAVRRAYAAIYEVGEDSLFPVG